MGTKKDSATADDGTGGRELYCGKASVSNLIVVNYLVQTGKSV